VPIGLRFMWRLSVQIISKWRYWHSTRMLAQWSFFCFNRQIFIWRFHVEVRRTRTVDYPLLSPYYSGWHCRVTGTLDEAKLHSFIVSRWTPAMINATHVCPVVLGTDLSRWLSAVCVASAPAACCCCCCCQRYGDDDGRHARRGAVKTAPQP